VGKKLLLCLLALVLCGCSARSGEGESAVFSDAAVVCYETIEEYRSGTGSWSMESSDAELIGEILKKRDSLQHMDTSRPMDFPRYLIILSGEDKQEQWQIDRNGVIAGDHLGGGNHWLENGSLFEELTQLLEPYMA